MEGGSADDDGSVASWLNEQIYGVFSALYSMNLSVDTKRSKHHRATQGQYNGSIAPLGYDLVTEKLSTPSRPAGLYINLREVALVRRAFRLSATGKYSDFDIAAWLNERPYIQKIRTGKLPVGKQMVRDMLQNRHYTGRVCYAETLYRGTRGEGKRSSRKRKVWFDGHHSPIVDDELFYRCQRVRTHNSSRRGHPKVVHTYLLQDKVFCARCMARKPLEMEDVNYGNMPCGWLTKQDVGSYRCQARDRGYHPCEQGYIRADTIDAQVVEALKHLKIPAGLTKRIQRAVENSSDNAEAIAQIDNLKEQLQRIDLSWDEGFLSPQEYVGKRKSVQAEIDALRPLQYDNLEEAADILQHFDQYWSACEDIEAPEEARQQLLGKIVDRVFVYDGVVVGIALYSDYSIVLNADTLYMSHISGKIQEVVETETGNRLVARTSSGSDGI